MLLDFNTLPANSRIWIYQSNRTFSDAEEKEIDQTLSNFLKQWKSHNETLWSSYEIKYSRFIIIAIDQNHQSPSGCAIDAQVRIIKDFEESYNILLLDRMNVSFRQGKYIVYKELSEFKAMVKNGAVSKNTIVFNNVVTNIEEYQSYWEVPATESWHKRFF